jgi:GT2 family glycosyltransferase
LLLNNDLEILSGDTIKRAVAWLSDISVGVVGGLLLYPDGFTIQHAGIELGIVNGIAGHIQQGRKINESFKHDWPFRVREAPAVTAAMTAFTKTAFVKAGGFEESMPTDFNDVDFCLKIQKLGLKVIYDPELLALHYESYTRSRMREGMQLFKDARMLMLKKWGRKTFKNDYFLISYKY